MLELCDKLNCDKNDKADELTDDKNEKYDNDDKDGNDKNKLTNNVSDKEVTHDSKDKNANNDVMTDTLTKQYKDVDIASDGDKFDNDNKDKGIRTDTMTDKKVKHKKYTGLDIELNCIKKKKLKSDDMNVPFSTFKKNLNF